MADRIRVTVIAPKRLSCYQLRVTDTRTADVRTQMTDVPRGGRNRKRAEAEAAELQRTLNARAGFMPERVTWDQFRDRVDSEFLAGSASSTQGTYDGIINTFESRCRPRLMRDVDSAALKAYCQFLRSERYREATVQKHLRHLLAVFRWAAGEGLLTDVPAKPSTPPASRGKATQSKGRPLSNEEVHAYLAAIPMVCDPKRDAQIRRLVEGILLTGFRLGDALRAKWERDADVYPLFREGLRPVWVFTEAQKNRRSEEVAMLPSCEAFISATPADSRTGWVFPLDGPNGRLVATTVSKILSAVGREAGVAVTDPDPRTGIPKYASAHDLRRTFAKEVSFSHTPAVLKHLMRHRSHLTTDRFYLGATAQEVAMHLSKSAP